MTPTSCLSRAEEPLTPLLSAGDAGTIGFQYAPTGAAPASRRRASAWRYCCTRAGRTCTTASPGAASGRSARSRARSEPGQLGQLGADLGGGRGRRAGGRHGGVSRERGRATLARLLPPGAARLPSMALAGRAAPLPGRRPRLADSPALGVLRGRARHRPALSPARGRREPSSTRPSAKRVSSACRRWRSTRRSPTRPPAGCTRAWATTKWPTGRPRAGCPASSRS